MNTTASKVKLALIVIASLLILTLIPTGIYCAVEKVNPVEVFSQGIGNTSDKIVGKWQSEDGATAYEFYDTGRYDGYLSVISYSGTYEVDGKYITLKKIGSSADVTYKASVSNDKLTLTLIDEFGEIDEAEEVLEYNRVERIDTKSFSELFDTIKDEITTDTKE